MKQQEIATAGVWWLLDNTSLVIQFLIALVPVLALGVAGYALYVVAQRDKGRER